MLRLFAGIALPPEITQSLAASQAGLRNARWRPAEGLHITLRFFGEVDERRAQDIGEALEAAVIPPFSLGLEGVGAFGEGHRLHAVWAGVKPSEPLLRLASRCETAARRTGCAPEARKFTPHVTLAYLKRAEPEAVAAWLEAQGGLAAGPFLVERFGLYSSWPGEDGSRYELERYYPLR